MLLKAKSVKGRQCYNCMEQIKPGEYCLEHSQRVGSRAYNQGYCLPCVGKVFNEACTDAGGVEVDCVETPVPAWKCEVISVRRMEGAGNLKAFVDIRLNDELVITQCAVMDGKRGLFATLPRQLARDGRWRDVVIVAEDKSRTIIEGEILKAYNETQKEKQNNG